VVKRLEVSTRYLICWEQDGLAISPGVEEEVCKYICCLLIKTEVRNSILLSVQEWRKCVNVLIAYESK